MMRLLMTSTRYLSDEVVAGDDAMDDHAHAISAEHPLWCHYRGGDAFKITIFICIFVVPLTIVTFAYSYRLWRAKLDIVQKYLEEGMSIRGIVVERKARRRTDLDGRSYKRHEIVLEYDPLFAACLVEGENEDAEQEQEVVVEEQERDRFIANTSHTQSSSAARILYRKRYAQVSRETFYYCVEFGSIRLLVLSDARSAFPVSEILHLQQHSGVCWVWCVGLLVLATLLVVALNAACANTWYCWLIAMAIVGGEIYVASLGTRCVYSNFVDSIVLGDTQEIDKNSNGPGSTTRSTGKFARLTKVHSEPAPVPDSTQQILAGTETLHSRSQHFVVACPMVKL